MIGVSYNNLYSVGEKDFSYDLQFQHLPKSSALRRFEEPDAIMCITLIVSKNICSIYTSCFKEIVIT